MKSFILSGAVITSGRPMSDSLVLNLDKIGILALSLPAAAIILLGREWFLLNMISRLGIFIETHYHPKNKNPFLTFDLWAFILVSFWGYSWGGLISRNKKDTFITFIFAQLWFVMIIILSVIFLHAKDLGKDQYTYMLFIVLIKKSWTLHLVNYIPIPPFDASFFYAQKPAMTKVNIILKILVTCAIILIPLSNDFISGESFLKWVGFR